MNNNPENIPGEFSPERAARWTILHIEPEADYCVPRLPYYPRGLEGEAELRERNDRVMREITQIAINEVSAEGALPSAMQINTLGYKGRNQEVIRVAGEMNLPPQTAWMLNDAINHSAAKHDTENLSSYAMFQAWLESDVDLYTIIEQRLKSDSRLRRYLFQAQHAIASPAQSLYVFEKLEKIETMELARYAHNLDYQADIARQMDGAVLEAIRAMGGEVYGEPRFHGVKIKQIDSPPHISRRNKLYFERPPRGIIVSHKQDVGRSLSGSEIRRRDKYFLPVGAELRRLIAASEYKIQDEEDSDESLYASPELREELVRICAGGESSDARLLTTIYYVFDERRGGLSPEALQSRTVTVEAIIDYIVNKAEVAPVEVDREVMRFLTALPPDEVFDIAKATKNHWYGRGGMSHMAHDRLASALVQLKMRPKPNRR